MVYGAGHGHFYISQSDKGGMVFGGDLDGYNSYAQRGNLPIYTDVASCAMNVMPALGRIKLLRQWAELWICLWMARPLSQKQICQVFI